MSNSPSVQSKNSQGNLFLQNPVTQFVVNWFKPRSQDRDESFREGTIRITAAFVLVVTALGLVASRVFFGSYAWDLFSWSTLILLSFFIALGSAIAVSRGHIITAGWLMVVMFTFAAVSISMLDGYWATLVIPAFTIATVMTALVLPRSAILPTAAVSIVMFYLSTLTVTSNAHSPFKDTPATLFIVDMTFIIMIEAVLLRQLRGEFDQRLAAVNQSLHETEIARAEADQANSAKSQFLAKMSHELRTPLNAIIGYTEIMLGGMAGEVPANMKQLLDYIHTNGKRQLDLVNDILDLAKVESGKLVLQYAPANPQKMVGEVLESVRSLAIKKDIGLVLDVAEETPEVVMMDEKRVKQIVVNLLSNSLKFTKKGSVTLKLGPDTSTSWYMAVVDTGIGIPADALERIFNPFDQVDSTDTRTEKGTGLGLSMVKQFVEKMQGTITVTSELGKGSTFKVVLPRNAVTQAALTPEVATKPTPTPNSLQPGGPVIATPAAVPNPNLPRA
jgi:signal transduction histidine kinase